MLHFLGKHRDTVILLAGIVLICWSLSASLQYHVKPPKEFGNLQQHMNDDSPKGIPHKSSFDWSTVAHRKPPDEFIQLPTGKAQHLGTVQANFALGDAEYERTRELRRREVKKVFVYDWEAYRKHAWMKDALKPISGGSRDQFSGWAATLVDSLDTIWIMGLRKTFDEAVDAATRIDFGKSSSNKVNTFETNIRYLGGLLAAYDLSSRETLLQKAKELGDLIYMAFNTNNRLPVDMINVEAAKDGKLLVQEPNVVSASPGTLSLELTRLSQLTGDPKYYDAISRVMDLFHHGQDSTRVPGLWPTMVSMKSGNVVAGSLFTLAGNADSLYEYLPKMHVLLSGRDPKYEEMTQKALEAAKLLLFRPMIPENEPILMPSGAGIYSDGVVKLDEESEHLGCYLGGVYALAGKVFGNHQWVNIGEKLTLGCVYSYRSFPTGIMPERLTMVACDSFENCEWDEKVFNEKKKKQREAKDHLPLGFTTAKDPRYLLRPEAIESVFIMYRITGDTVWQDLGWDMFTAIINGTKTSHGTHASIMDVTLDARHLPQEDYMESFWFAETLKYFYLLFSPPDIIDLDQYVLNTEAHPFLRT
ncbi:endoplasmic reticulum mannosyl-oligosaccharide 1,2-alpha-mannosidase [Xylariaceae sp. FL0255]|nr:endoplasmic reticulum mannosyl-oligosaccharide 1,2-alpha-mannosidase [Xylariaceae sp. FL0255]